MKQLFYSMSSGSGMFRLADLATRRQPIILAFHGVTAEAPGSLYNREGGHLYRPIFRRLMHALARRYRFVSLARLSQWLRGDSDIPDHAVAITFDDGYRNVLVEAAPVLQEVGAPATVFVVTDFVLGGRMLWTDRLAAVLGQTRNSRVELSTEGRAISFPLAGDSDRVRANTEIRRLCKILPDEERRVLIDSIASGLNVGDAAALDAWPDFAPLGPDDLLRLTSMGFTIGSHTCSHPIVARCSSAMMKREIHASKARIEAVTGVTCDEFAYPNGAVGDFDGTTRREVISAGYKCATTTLKQRVTRGKDAFEIPRCILTHNRISDREFRAEVSGYAAFLRRVRRSLSAGGSVPTH